MSLAYCTFDNAVGNDSRWAMLSSGAEAFLVSKEPLGLLVGQTETLGQRDPGRCGLELRPHLGADP